MTPQAIHSSRNVQICPLLFLLGLSRVLPVRYLTPPPRYRIPGVRGVGVWEGEEGRGCGLVSCPGTVAGWAEGGRQNGGRCRYWLQQ